MKELDSRKLLRTYKLELDTISKAFKLNRKQLAQDVGAVIMARYAFMKSDISPTRISCPEDITFDVIQDLLELSKDNSLSYSKNLLRSYLSDPI